MRVLAQHIWNVLPENIRNRLLLGGDGQTRLLSIAESLMPALESSPHADALINVFRDITLAAWELDVCDARASAVLCQVQEQIPFLPPATAAFASAAAKARPARPEDAASLNSLYKSGDAAAIKKFLEQRRAAEPGNLFWLRFALGLGFQAWDLDWREAWLDHPGLPPAFRALAAADQAFARSDWQAALDGYADAFALTALPGLLAKQAESLLRLGERDRALALLMDAAARRPWQSNLLFRAADLAAGVDVPGQPPPGKGMVLLYSWNHAPDLDLCLRALAESALGDCRVALLDNGSTDATPAVAAAWRDKLGERLTLVTLPVNVGAPAARNWLLSLDEAKSADWVVFLDDDAVVPPDWLGHFGTARKARPGAGIIGCRVADHAAPLTLQSVDLHFDGPEHDGQGMNPLHAHAEGPDFGQYGYLRPCVSVTGCCHLITRSSLDAHGGFDLRFSPSQFDDLERDLRSSLAGDFPLYQGHLKVSHIKRSGLAANIPARQQANIAGNLVKLQQSIPAEQVAELQKADCAAQWRELQARFERLAAE